MEPNRLLCFLILVAVPNSLASPQKDSVDSGFAEPKVEPDDSEINHPWLKNCSDPCSGPACHRLTTKIKELVDFSVNPCNDFFGFVCNANSHNTESNLKPLYKLVNFVKNPPPGFEYIKTFYQSCTSISSKFTSEEVLFNCTYSGECSEEMLDPYGKIYVDFFRYIKRFSNEVAFPAVTSRWEDVTKDWFGGQGWNWWDFSANVLKNSYFLGAFQYNEGGNQGTDIFRANMFFVPMVDTTVQDIELEYGDLSPSIYIVPMRVSGFLRNGGDQAKIAKYKKLMKAIIGSLGNSSTLDEDVERIIELELELGNINTANHIRSADAYYDWDSISIKELYDLVPTIEWKDYIQACFSSNKRFKIDRSTLVLVPPGDVMQSMGKWVRELERNRRDQANLLIWRMLIMFANTFMNTGTKDDDIQEDIFHSLAPSKTTRAGNCITQIQTLFPGVEDDMLIAKYIDAETRDYIMNLFSSFKEQFGIIIDESDWMTRRTQLRAKEKLNGTTITFGDYTPKTPEYDNLKNNITNDYIGNILAIGNYNWDSLVHSLSRDKSILRGDESENNAYYFKPLNHVTIKTGFLKALFGLGFSLSYPPAILYGGFAAHTLGHELTHGFDDDGRLYDKDGYQLDWWESEDDLEYKNRTQCMVDQYSNFSISFNGVNYTITGDKAGENIADNGGVKVAYKALMTLSKKDECVQGVPFSGHQLFWLGWAMAWCHDGTRPWLYATREDLLSTPVHSTGHSPEPWRTNVVLSNMPDFARDFQCSVGEKMNPLDEERCSVW